MSQIPEPYNRQHIFGSASSNNPSNPVQGTNLDAEFNALHVSMDETQARLAEIQRDDGQLKNEAVGIDQLSPEAMDYITTQTQAIADQAADARDAAEGFADASAASALASAGSALAAQASADDAEASAAESEASAADSAAASAWFCGSSAVAPTTRLNGSALQQGDEYLNTVDYLRYNWTGAAWVALNSSAQSLETRLADPTAASKGAGLVAIYSPGAPPATVYSVLANGRWPIEAFGAVGDYNPTTLVGTDNTAAFALAIASGRKIQLKRNAKYMITGDTIVQSGMDWYGDENYSPEIYPKFTTSGRLLLRTPLTGPVITNVNIRGITLARIGSNAEHGALVGNFDGFNLDVKCIASPTALGGAICIAGIYPHNGPSKNGNIKAIVDYGGNFGVQIGNLDTGTVQVQATNSMREVIGLEPQALARFDFVQGDVAADTITIAGHGLTTGYPLLYSPQSNAIIPALTRPDYWFAIVVDANRIKLAASKALALVGTNVALGAFTGTHVLLKCGICRNVEILPSVIEVGDVPVAGTLTGVVDFTSASGGYHEGITVNPITVIERNPTSGSHGIFIAGAHNITVNDFQSIGCKLTGALVDIAFVNNVFTAAGNIAPSPNMGCRPRNIILNNPVVREFKLVGINVRDGQCEVRDGYAHSDLPGVIGLQLGSSATLRNSRIINSTADCPNGTGLDLGAYGGNNRDMNVVALRNRKITRVNEQSLYKAIVGTALPVCGLTSQSGAVSTYAGQLYVIARSSTTESSNVAAYWLDIMLSNTGGTPTVSVVKSSGLISGGAGSYPSFTWSIDASNNLMATPIGSTSTTATWNYYLNAVGDLALT